MKLGVQGTAFVVDLDGRLIAHPDISLVLRNIDLSHLSYVRAALMPAVGPVEDGTIADDFRGRPVLTASAPIPSLGWTLFVELPVREALAPVYASILRSVALLLAALGIAGLAGSSWRGAWLFQFRRCAMVRRGSAEVLNEKISIDTGDELQALGDQFNSMAAQLQDLYRTLERKVEQRTVQLEVANQAKSRFLAAASHVCGSRSRLRALVCGRSCTPL